MKTLVVALLTLSLLSNSTVTQAKPNTCANIKEEIPSKKTVVRSFLKFNIRMKLPVNTRTMPWENGGILIVDNGTYKYLQCAEGNPHALGKGIFGVLISKGTKTYDVNKEIPNKPLRYIVATEDLQEIALRLVFYNNTVTDIKQIGEGSFGRTKEEAVEEVKDLLEIEKTVTAISHSTP
ncbi:hypothetical protein [Nostoc sp. UHCC 0252]|uniref:hypothetical protein n=1 Tax=Nostoc sp. UHCC 0252 TaxID=3110241 RepID=UPI002B1EF849|nr:hypothetical protein [Nostoc sp. UHCC 0252]MEA5605475.1 hypothetical protein [Nostoc sp. UHCC 0252]